jgi:hypothetical protein
VFVAIVVILAVVVTVVSSGGSGPRATPPTAATRSAVGASPRAQPGPGACSLHDADQAVPAAAPAGVQWEIYDTVALPFSATAGPQVVTGDVARCYAHTPTGALLAAVQIAVRYVLAASWRMVLAEQVVPGPGASVYASQRAMEPDVNTTQSGQYGQIAGFQFVTYSPGLAVMQIVSRLPGGTLQVTTMTTQWSGTDWRLVLHDDGTPGGNVQQLGGMDGFVAWGGV